jgi:hypothetical protein
LKLPPQPAPPASPPQVNLVSEGPCPVSPTLSKAIDGYFEDE